MNISRKRQTCFSPCLSWRSVMVRWLVVLVSISSYAAHSAHHLFISELHLKLPDVICTYFKFSLELICNLQTLVSTDTFKFKPDFHSLPLAVGALVLRIHSSLLQMHPVHWFNTSLMQHWILHLKVKNQQMSKENYTKTILLCKCVSRVFFGCLLNQSDLQKWTRTARFAVKQHHYQSPRRRTKVI